ncbi:MAG: hypothetical protein VKJ04_06335 [Vampirovibrionales bacterium]|nr:hypothetical protein [Vampirovibrionales bacterium]
MTIPLFTDVPFRSVATQAALTPLATQNPESRQTGRSANGLLLSMPKDDFARPWEAPVKMEEQKLSQRRYPDWFVLTTLSNSFQTLSVNGMIPLDTIKQLRDQLHQQGRYREARVAHQLIQYKKVLINSGTPWEQGRFKSLPIGYSWPDIQWMLGKVQAGQDIDDIVTRHFDRKSREAIYKANWAEIINVPLTLFVGAGGFALFKYVSDIRKNIKLPKLIK